MTLHELNNILKPNQAILQVLDGDYNISHEVDVDNTSDLHNPNYSEYEEYLEYEVINVDIDISYWNKGPRLIIQIKYY